MRYYKNIKAVLLSVFVIGGLASCTKYDNPPAVYEDYDTGPDTSVSRKVLMISIDGLVGEEIKKKVPTNIARLQEHAKYSYTGLSDENTNDAATWASMMTGYGYKQHYINNENYLPEANPNDPHAETNFVYSVVYRVEDVNPALRTAAITRVPGLANTLLMDADESENVNSDEEVKNKALKSLEKEMRPDLTVLQFTDVLEAGKNSAFSADEEEYAAALEKVDEYIGELVEAVESHENYKYEDWLIIVTSNHGGIGNEYGGDSFTERNIFSLYYHKDIVSQELNAELLISPHFYGYEGHEDGGVRARNNSSLPEEKRYNLNETGELTIEAKVKINKKADGNYNYNFPPFLSKVDSRYGAIPGWSFFRSGSGVAFYVADGENNPGVTIGSVSDEGQWAVISVSMQGEENGEVTLKAFLNGSKVQEEKVELNLANVESNSPLTFGYQPEVFSEEFIDMHMADVRIWNKALPDEQIKENAQRLGLPEEFPNMDHLVGYWPMDDGDGVLRNQVEGMPDLPLSGDYQYKVYANDMDYVSDDAILLTNYEVSSQVLYWLEIAIQDEWALDGKVFLSQFEVEFLK